MRDQLTTLRVLGLVVLVEVAVRILPLPRVAHWLGVGLMTPARFTHPSCPLDETERRQIRAVDRVVRRWSIAPGPCLRKALVLGHLLRRHEPVLHIGVMRKDGHVLAHAWLDLGDASIDTDEHFQPFAPLGRHDSARVSSTTQEARR